MNLRNRVFFSIFLIAILVRLLTLGAYPLFDATEARYAEIARKMVETGDWISPQIDYGVPFWGKPPLSFWLTAASIKLFGVNEIAVRLPSFILALVIGWLTYHVALHQRGRNYALVGVLVLTTTALFFVMGGGVMTDPALALGTTLSMVAFWRALAEIKPNGNRWGYLFFIGLAVGILAKGLVAIVLTVAPIGLWILWHNKWSITFDRLPWVRGTVLMLAIALPWYLIAETRTPGFLEYFVVGEHWDRFMQSGWRGDLYGSAHAHPRGMIWLYWVVAAFPWSLIFIIVLIKRMWAPEPSRTALFKKEWLTYLSVWALVPLIFFTFASNILPTYVLPSLPACALLMAEISLWTSKKITDAKSPSYSVPLILASLTIPVIALLLIIFIVPNAAPYKSQKDLVAAYKTLRSDPSSRLIYLLHRPYSAEFYSEGKAEEVTNLEKTAIFLHNAKELFFAAQDGDVDKLPQALLMRLEQAGRFGDYRLLRKRQR